MSTKDWVTIIVSAFAFLLSAVATVITMRQKKYEIQRSMRQQITDLIGKLIDLNAEEAKLRHENANKFDLHLDGLSRIINDQRSAYARQAVYLIKQIPDVVSSNEYVTIATSLTSLGDVPQAEAFWLQAIKTCTDPLLKVFHSRGYANFLFINNRFEEGRKYYKRALVAAEDTAGDAEYNKWTRAQTYQMWAEAEGRAEFYKEAKALYEQGRIAAEQLRYPERRRFALGLLEESRKIAMMNPEEQMPEQNTEPQLLLF